MTVFSTSRRNQEITYHDRPSRALHSAALQVLHSDTFRTAESIPPYYLSAVLCSPRSAKFDLVSHTIAIITCYACGELTRRVQDRVNVGALWALAGWPRA